MPPCLGDATRTFHADRPHSLAADAVSVGRLQAGIRGIGGCSCSRPVMPLSRNGILQPWQNTDGALGPACRSANKSGGQPAEQELPKLPVTPRVLLGPRGHPPCSWAAVSVLGALYTTCPLCGGVFCIDFHVLKQRKPARFGVVHKCFKATGDTTCRVQPMELVVSTTCEAIAIAAAHPILTILRCL